MSLRPGSKLRLTDGGDLLTIWSPSHLPGCYWVHRGEGPGVVLVRVRETKADARPIVTLVEDS